VVIVMTAYGTIGSAVDAVKRGAENYLTKPLDDAEALVAIVGKGIEKSRLLQETRRLRDRLRERNVFGHIVGEHATLKKLLDMIAQVGPSRASVLIYGESGTGKELVAEAIHQNSPRANKPFVRLNCAALAETLLESELFGHERGAFTGAIGRREGRFKQADGGTLFLDEVSEIPMSLQVKLLRFLQTREFERVGGNETLKVDVRVLAATNKKLDEQVRAGRFREDLFYRLNVVSLEIPPLRDRPSDIPALASFFLRKYTQENGKAFEGFDDGALDALVHHRWPGNVRELENAIERAVVLGTGTKIERKHLPANVVPEDERSAVPNIPGATIYDLEKYAILKTLEAVGGSTSRAATVLGISARKIQYKLHEYQGGESAESRRASKVPEE
jgi:DNA-binding NtrC family response regulator